MTRGSNSPSNSAGSREARANHYEADPLRQNDSGEIQAHDFQGRERGGRQQVTNPSSKRVTRTLGRSLDPRLPWSVVEGGARERAKEGEREKAAIALRATRPHTVGYIGGCDQEQGVVEYPPPSWEGRY